MPFRWSVRLLATLGCALLPVTILAAPPDPNDNERAPFMGVYITVPPQALPLTAKWAVWLNRRSVWAHASYDPYFTKWEQIGEWADWNMKPWTDWVKEDPKRRVVYSIPIIPKNSGCTLADGASGAYNQYYEPLARGLVAHGLGNSILRLGWEFNGSWYPWSVKTPEDARHYAAYWRQIVKTIRAVPGTEKMQFVWNGANERAGFALEDAYPGDEFVDYVGTDVYDVCWTGTAYPYPPGANAQQRLACQQRAWDDWIYSEKPANGIQAWAKVAAAHNKPLCIPEWGLERMEKDGVAHGGLDNPWFIERMFRFIYDPANHVAFASYFDDADSTIWLDDRQPRYPEAAAAMQRLFSLPAAKPSNARP